MAALAPSARSAEDSGENGEDHSGLFGSVSSHAGENMNPQPISRVAGPGPTANGIDVS